MNNKTEIINEDDYLKECHLKRLHFIPKEYANLNEISNEIDNENNIKKLTTGCMLLNNGDYVFYLFMNKVSFLDIAKTNSLYENIKKHVTEDDLKASKDIAKELENTIIVNNMADRGFFYKGRKIVFDPNIFAKYFLGRVDLIALNDDEMAIYNRHGCYTRVNIESLILAKLTHKIMNEPKELWNSFNEKEGLRAVQRATKLVKNLTTNRNLVNLKNGMFNLTTYELKEHSP
ncbi:hypothetical protein [Clostridium butyricum]|uniref:hypothetical protein n=1 Tax=Clostridium butyricum TaxID=1492 RepID=UPI00168B63B1|nr:hypothetical protein [Clostridium butyricum]MDB2152489.1 hypothetical protein [Clostridium butyricum]